VIIALTASAFEEDRRVVLADGCDDFVRKPFREAEILGKLAQHLGVRFVYEQAKPSVPGTSLEKPEDAIAALKEHLTPEALATLPAGWMAEVARAAQQADGALVLELIQRIRAPHTSTADALASLVRSYRFDAIVELAKELRG
jgi:hypothetical protein